jgi:8-oxo-dGTP pyrophosphatase MutT (NUDIX family)
MPEMMLTNALDRNQITALYKSPADPAFLALKNRTEHFEDSRPRNLIQVGALPIQFEGGTPSVMLVTSRETKRWVIPKGWPMRGKKNWAAAEQEAKEEAGVIGKTCKRPVGEFYYFKRRNAHFDLCRVEVFVIDFQKQLTIYREKGQRDTCWLSLEDAAEIVQEPGLSALLRKLDLTSFRKPTKKKRSAKYISKNG